MPYHGDVLGGIVGGAEGFLGPLDKLIEDNYLVVLEAVLVVVVLVLVLWQLWVWMSGGKKEGWGEGGKNVERQTMDQSYFSPPYEYTPAAQVAARSEGMENPRDKSYAAQAVAGPGSGVTSLANLMDQEARAKFLIDNQCAQRGAPYMGDPWTWLVEASKESYMGQRKEEYGDKVKDAELTPILAEQIGSSEY